MAISNLKKDLYDDENNTMEEEVSSASFSDYVPEKPVTIGGEEKEIKESIFDDAKEALKNLSDTIGKEENPGLFKNIFKKALDKIVGEEGDGSASEDVSSEDKTDGSEEDEKEDSVMDQLAAILADKNIEEKVNICLKCFPEKYVEDALKFICKFNEKESKFIIEN